MVTVLLAVVLIMSSLGGCGNTSQGEGEDIQILTMIEGSGPVYDWDPAIMFSTDNLVLCNIYETLLKYDPDEDDYIPVLATNYSSNPEGTVWTFDIREGVKFHDGTDLNAEAVKFSIERTMEM